jgi:type I restriction enzyme S subunit
LNSDTNHRFSLPSGWEWTDLGTTGQIFTGNSVSEEEKARLRNVTDGLPFIATKDVGYGRDPLDYDNGVTVPTGAPGFRIARAGTVLICAEGGSAGRKSGITDREVCFGNKLLANEPVEGVEPLYLLALYQSPWFYNQFTLRMTGIIGGIAQGEFRVLPVPLPPTAEQRRIVTKVDELINLCDQLEKAQTERASQRDALRVSSLQLLISTNGRERSDLAKVQFFLDTSPRMVTKSQHVVAIRQAIVDLAVQGRFVSQDPGDVPAAEALSRVSANTTFRGTRAALPDDLPILPDGWCWARVGKLADRVTVGHVGPTTNWYTPEGVPFLRSQNVRVNRFSETGLVRITPSRHESLRKSRILPGDVLVVRSGANRGMACVAPEELGEANCADLVIIQRPSGVNSRYLSFFINTVTHGYVREQEVGIAIPHFNTQSVSALPVPLPPLSEQNRIVAKVDELMALCDQLEVALTLVQTETQRLLQSLLQEALKEERDPIDPAHAVAVAD